MAAQSSAKPVLLLGVLVMVAGMGATMYLLVGSADDMSGDAQAVGVPPAQIEPVSPAPRPIPSRALEPELLAEAELEPADGPDRAKQRMARDLERERIWSALRRKHQLEPGAEPEHKGAPDELALDRLPTLDPEYVREAIREQLVPVAIDCYNSALQDDPELAGSIVLKFTIVGAEDIGGVVEESELGEESTLDSPFLRECMRESVMAVVFEPPPDGGTVEVSYPLYFEPE